MDDQVKKNASLMEKAQKIIVLTGAGISTSAGIPDFRSPKTGLYHNLEKYNLPYPEAIFDIDYFIHNPKPFFELAKELLPGNYHPTPSHRFMRLLEEHGKLVRNYTQNIDGLERRADIQNIIECHGSFQTATCLHCEKKYKLKDIEDDIRAGSVPYCACHPKAIIKPDIVFFNEPLPSIFFESVLLDFPKCNLLLIMGTSLNVYPVAGLVNEVKPDCPIILINKTPPPVSYRNMEMILADCDQICSQFAEKIFGRNL